MCPHAGDDTGELERVLSEAAAECDLVLSSRSTSASAVESPARTVAAFEATLDGAEAFEDLPGYGG